VIDN